MYFWKDEQLALDLAQNKLSESEKFKYLLLSTIIVTIGILVQVFSYEEKLFYPTLIGTIGSLSIELLGLLMTFKLNQGNNGRDFIARNTCLFIPVFVRSILITLGLSIVVPLILIFVLKMKPPELDIIMVAPLMILTSFYMFYRTVRCFKIINRNLTALEIPNNE